MRDSRLEVGFPTSTDDLGVDVGVRSVAFPPLSFFPFVEGNLSDGHSWCVMKEGVQ